MGAVVQMLLAILSCCTAEELEESSSEEEGEGTGTKMEISEEQQQRRAEIRAKILAVGRMRRVFQLLRYAGFRHSPANISDNCFSIGIT